jgi:uncharacterized repeat protein (TIGR01451 family)
MLTYTITVANAGPSPAENVVLTDVIPAGLMNAEFSTNGGVTFTPWTGSLSLGTLAAGASEIILIRGTVNPAATGPITNTATVTSTTPDTNPGNNTSTIITNIQTPIGQAFTCIIESVALQETALGSILNAEGEKLQAIINTPGVTPAQLLEVNCLVTRLIGTISRLEIVLQSKLEIASGQVNNIL